MWDLELHTTPRLIEVQERTQTISLAIQGPPHINSTRQHQHSIQHTQDRSGIFFLLRLLSFCPQRVKLHCTASISMRPASCRMQTLSLLFCVVSTTTAPKNTYEAQLRVSSSQHMPLPPPAGSTVDSCSSQPPASSQARYAVCAR